MPLSKPSFLHCTAPRQSQVTFLVSLLLCRAAYTYTGTYTSSELPKAMLDLLFDMAFAPAPRRTKRTHALKVKDLLRRMKINLFSTDHTTREIKDILKDNWSHRHINAYILTLFTSRDFVKAFRDSGAYSKSYPWVSQKLARTWDYLDGPIHTSFATAFNPQRRQYWTYKKMTDATARTTILKNVARVVPPLKTKNAQQIRRSKRDMCKDLRQLHGLGPFLAKNMWQFLTVDSSKYSLPPDNNSWGEVGKGGRTGANILNSWPFQFSTTSSSQAAADFWALTVSEIRDELLACPELQPDAKDTDTMVKAKQMLVAELQTIEGTQFVLCEWSKVVHYVLHGNADYERYFSWDTAQEQTSSDEDTD